MKPYMEKCGVEATLKMMRRMNCIGTPLAFVLEVFKSGIIESHRFTWWPLSVWFSSIWEGLKKLEIKQVGGV
jgi:hypothetical protein